eukprot:CAMPEP_0184692196 /NCGR_PEP_ID=MMETSP0313-20130426/776_1 /TAXON_ID=2792 /ORGANISM="Porphyridium aerugineum, Strain SAG 1380-2" /LENGTH=216 /DNA_ID=CAMNT_0027150009 /DNA_START=230 /DNA_END=880 /DNA_ORIENTATION=+
MIGFVSGCGVVSSQASALVGKPVCVKKTVMAVAKQQPTMAFEATFKKALTDFKTDFPQFAKKGWGCTAKAERWNGRHAMFGMLAIWLTAYAKGHGLLPAGDLDITQWGTLAELGGYTPISVERAVILIAHIHVLLVSVAATIAPFSFQDKLLLDDNEKDEEPMGLIPPMEVGLTKAAETFNGRLAMVGIMSIVFGSFATQTSILDFTNAMFGNVFY